MVVSKPIGKNDQNGHSCSRTADRHDAFASYVKPSSVINSSVNGLWRPRAMKADGFAPVTMKSAPVSRCRFARFAGRDRSNAEGSASHGRRPHDRVYRARGKIRHTAPRHDRT